MKKRGPIIGISGAVLTAISFAIVMSIYPASDPTMQGEIFLGDFLDGMFDHVSEETQIYPGTSHIFSYSTSESDIPLLWGVQIIDFQNNDEFSVTISNLFGDILAETNQEGPVLFDMFVVPKNDVYNFEVTNTGNRPMLVSMMFSEDPDNSPALSDPNSPLMNTLIPLAISGMMLIAGIIIMIVGAIITLIDWKNRKNSPRYF